MRKNNIIVCVLCVCVCVVVLLLLMSPLFNEIVIKINYVLLVFVSLFIHSFIHSFLSFFFVTMRCMMIFNIIIMKERGERIM